MLNFEISIWVYFWCALAVGALIDLKKKIVPNILSFSLFFVLLVLLFLEKGFGGIVINIYGALIAGAVGWILWVQKIIGAGDHKLLISAGLVFGLSGVAGLLAGVGLAGGIISLVTIVVELARGQTFKQAINKKIAYSPAILLGAILFEVYLKFLI